MISAAIVILVDTMLAAARILFHAHPWPYAGGMPGVQYEAPLFLEFALSIFH